MKQLEIGDRIDVFKVTHDSYGGEFTIGAFYAEVLGNKYSGNSYGRDMIGNRPIPETWGAGGWHMNIPDNMVKVGTLVITALKCHICGAKTEYECRDCENPICDNCTVSYTAHNQIDYTLCKECYSFNQESFAEYKSN